MKILPFKILFIGFFAFYSCGSSNKSEYKEIEDEQSYSTEQDYSPEPGRNKDHDFTDVDCSDFATASEDAYSYSQKAYKSENWDEIKSYLKKAMASFEDAMEYSEDCGYEDGYEAADEGYDYAKKGYNSNDYDDVKTYAKKARSSADAAVNHASECGN